MSLKKYILTLSLFLVSSSFFSQGAYYNGFDLTLEGIALKNELATLIISSHNNYLSYSQVWDVLKSADLNPENANDVLLIYGYSDTDGNQITDRTRDKEDNGGSVGDWNREHVYPKSLGTPNLGTSGPGSDAHHLRSSDVQMNSNRGSLKFANDVGISGPNGGGWYPGDEWKGDCARMMMYMYLRYGNQCLPSNVGVGSNNSIDNNMVNLFLDWNAADPVSEYELTRNDVVESAQGNRNPFIDNPVLATLIWGGTPAEDTWGITGLDEIDSDDSIIKIFPNPCIDYLTIQTDSQEDIQSLFIYNQLGILVKHIPFMTDINIQDLREGFYFLGFDFKGILKMEPFVIIR